ncbi:2-hydroxyacid dehydrogenase [Pigmentiphaga litoralis]|uniref:Lactate dehydrogenase-like 2-hydroxyacid dehydrogenase n=1 Tax=Pigmentiphaga litoralis TaxID=516702 RepID=A0A7Y9LPC5_9BURK|nr:2-hydroxyacid dehydrogenase [Pigmentiphaga litoralis]NYE26788.1 lactate dehydrogenase-like 2-hydroxyacid dehydrogenase [Pigmentiphaga litoralis]NYE85802.1 lactate dehydrogenase-like 2-hydroxyacid dehydrogenase [Pigmentiphaga litoralis]
MTPSLLQIGRLAPELEAELAATFPVHLLAKEADVPAFLERHGSTFNGAVTSARVGMDATLIDALPNLKVVSSFGVGYELLDVDALKRRGIVASNTPDVLNDCVADVAFGLVIDAARGMSAADRFVRRGDWLNGAFPLQTQVARKRLGILGLGRIGQAIARRSSGFEMDVRYHSRNPVQDVPWQHEPSLTALAEWCDFLVVAVAGGPSTRHLVSADVLAALGPKGFLINIARGTVVDEAALVTALTDKRLGGAGLDVFEFEPRVPQALMTLDNVVLLPHIASGTFETRKAMGDLVISNLKHYFADGQLQTPIA